MKTSSAARKSTRTVVYAAAVAALYVLFTELAQAMGLASGAIQLRLSEALTVLPVFTGAAVPGLTVGCFIANLLCGAVPTDLIFGTLATLIGAVGTYFLRKKPMLAPIPPILSNTLIIPFVLTYAYGAQEALWLLFLTVGAGEILSCGVLGTALTLLLRKQKHLFR